MKKLKVIKAIEGFMLAASVLAITISGICLFTYGPRISLTKYMVFATSVMVFIYNIFVLVADKYIKNTEEKAMIRFSKTLDSLLGSQKDN